MSLTRQQVRDFDRHAIEQLGIPGIVLMENAGGNAARLIVEAMERECGTPPTRAHIAVLCGGGNNGGDGYVIARHLHNRGTQVTIYAAKDVDDLTGDAGVNARACAKMGMEMGTDFSGSQWGQSVVLVDALLGTGATGEVREDLAQLIHQVNATSGPFVVAVDVPSGLDPDTGDPTHATIKADMTITFVDRKTGFDNPQSEAYTGVVHVVDIGVKAGPWDKEP